MKHFALSLLAFSCLFLVAGQSLTAQEKYTLKSSYPPGQYEQVINIDMDMTVGISDKAKIPMKQAQTQYITIDAAEKNADGTQKIVMEITRIAMDQKSGMINMKYDSADTDAAQSPLKMMGTMVGTKFTMLLDKDGNPTKIEGINEMFDKLTKDQDYPLPVVEMLKAQMTDESMTKTLDISKEMMPQVPVAVGETWKTEGTSDVPMLGKAKTNLENTLKEIKTEDGKRIAVIFSKSVVSSEGTKEMEPMPGMKMTLQKADISAETTVLLDIESGLMLSSTADTGMDMDMEMVLGDRTIVQKIAGKGKTTITVTPKQSR